MIQYWLLSFFVLFYGVNSADYDVYDFVNTGICQMRRNVFIETLYPRKDVRMLADFRRGAIYEQTWNSSSFKRYSECKFTLQTPPGSTGLYLIIRKLNLRREANGNCIDTVTVKQSNEKKTRFCYTPKDVPRSFSDPSHLKISIKLDNYIPLPTVDDTLQIQLIATQKAPCSHMTNVIQCEPGDPTSCIDKSFYLDYTVNCPNCIEENGCSMESIKVFVADKQSIVLTAFVSLVTTMVIFGGCIWCLYKNRRCISCSNRNADDGIGGGGRTHHRANVSAGRHSVELQGSVNELRPTAPTVDEKDLPPSYDALFPVVVDYTAAGPMTVSAATSPTAPMPVNTEESETETK